MSRTCRRLVTGLALLLALVPGVTHAQPRWTLTPELRIGSVDDEAQALTRVGSVLIGSDGSMYVAQPQDNQIRVYAADGGLRRIIGRKGSGPGEFEGLAGLHWLADTLVVYDFQHNRLTLFSAAGALLYTLSILPRVELPYIGGSAHALLADGGALMTPSAPSAVIADGAVRRIPMLRVARDGTVLDTVYHREVRRSQVAVKLGPGQAFGTQPFADAPLTMEHAAGLVLVDRPIATSARGATFTVRWLSYSGDTLRSRSYRYTPTPIAASVADSIVAARAEPLMQFAARVGASRRDLENALRDALVIPRFHPPVLGLRAGSQGEVWLNRGPRTSGTTRYNVLSPTGDVLAVLDMPARIRVVALHGDHLYAAEADELDVPYLVRYRINRTPR